MTSIAALRSYGRLELLLYVFAYPQGHQIASAAADALFPLRQEEEEKSW